MANGAIVNAWVDALSARNYGNAGAWTVRFELDDAQLIEQARSHLSAAGAIMGANGGPLEYVATFPSSSAFEVSTILVNAGALLSRHQT